MGTRLLVFLLFQTQKRHSSCSLKPSLQIIVNSLHLLLHLQYNIITIILSLLLQVPRNGIYSIISYLLLSQVLIECLHIYREVAATNAAQKILERVN